MHININIIITWLMLILLWICAPQIAARSIDAGYLLKVSNAQANISKQKAASIAQQRIKGRVLSVELAGDAYRVKILSDEGSVHILSINASNGAVISSN